MQITPWSRASLNTTLGINDWGLESNLDAYEAFAYLNKTKCGSTLYNNKNTIGNTGYKIDRVIYNDPATIVFWKDGTKTVVKCQKGDTYNPETGLAMCIIKRVCGNKANYNNIFTKWLPKEGE